MKKGQCTAHRDAWRCEREKGHKGKHAAYRGLLKWARRALKARA